MSLKSMSSLPVTVLSWNAMGFMAFVGFIASTVSIEAIGSTGVIGCPAVIGLSLIHI